MEGSSQIFPARHLVFYFKYFYFHIFYFTSFYFNVISMLFRCYFNVISMLFQRYFNATNSMIFQCYFNVISVLFHSAIVRTYFLRIHFLVTKFQMKPCVHCVRLLSLPLPPLIEFLLLRTGYCFMMKLC